jgi:hypothetical protein
MAALGMSDGAKEEKNALVLSGAEGLLVIGLTRSATRTVTSMAVDRTVMSHPGNCVFLEFVIGPCLVPPGFCDEVLSARWGTDEDSTEQMSQQIGRFGTKKPIQHKMPNTAVL